MDEEDLKVSVCLECARHPSLKRNIEAASVIGVCGICCKTDTTVRNPNDTESMVMLIRALIRFYWDELAYNHHWGGDPVLDLFSNPENPILKPFACDEHLDEIDYLLQEPAYPDWDKGISVYAGFDSGGQRMMNFAISRARPKIVSDLRKRIDADNFEEVSGELDAVISPFISDLKFVLPKEGIWFRARTGYENRFVRSLGFDSEIVRKPHMGAQIGASPNPGNGRLNREGSPVLYLGSNPYTALAEIRPHPGHYVSLGGFEISKDLCVADFDPDIALFATNENRLEMYEVIHYFDRLMSTPVTPEDKISYRITQLLAEVLKQRGFDAVRFRSSVSEGANLCVFDPTNAAFVDTHSGVRYVESVSYTAPERPSTIAPGSQLYPLNG